MQWFALDDSSMDDVSIISRLLRGRGGKCLPRHPCINEPSIQHFYQVELS